MMMIVISAQSLIWKQTIIIQGGCDRLLVGRGRGGRAVKRRVMIMMTLMILIILTNSMILMMNILIIMLMIAMSFVHKECWCLGKFKLYKTSRVAFQTEIFCAAELYLRAN